MDEEWLDAELFEPLRQAFREKLREETEKYKEETLRYIKKKLSIHFSGKQMQEGGWNLDRIKQHLEKFWKEFPSEEDTTTSERTLTNDGEQKGKSIEKDAQLLQMFATSAPEDSTPSGKISWKKNPVKLGLPKVRNDAGVVCSELSFSTFVC